MNKYRNIKTVIDNITFDSALEGRRYSFLKMMERAGEITGLKLQPKYLLQESYLHKQKRIREISYIADFEYTYNGKRITEDCKGIKTEIYKMKLKMFQFRYPHINFYEVYKDNDLGGMV